MSLMQFCQRVEFYPEAVKQTAAACTDTASRHCRYGNYPTSEHNVKLQCTVCLRFPIAGGRSADDLQNILKQQLRDYTVEGVNSSTPASTVAWVKGAVVM